MRDNGPITNREVEPGDGDLLVSRTDAGGRITFVNQAFIQISGFSEQELTGAPHNIVRHPGMPKAAFADLWTTIKAGKPWEGLVKNRTKSGDHYWVRANVTPVVENGRIADFVSIRSKPTRAQIKLAERAYASLLNGSDSSLGLHEGGRIRRGWRQRLGMAAASVSGRLTAVFATLIVGTLGLQGMRGSNDALRTVYEDRTIPTAQLSGIAERLRDNLNHVPVMALDLKGDRRDRIGTLSAEARANTADIARTWDEYMGQKVHPCGIVR